MTCRFSILFVALFSALPTLGWGQDSSSTPKLKAIYGQNNPVCRETIRLAKQISRDDFSENWGKSFENFEWQQVTQLFTNNLGFSHEQVFQYVPLDIYNDGNQDVAVIETTNFQSENLDNLFVLQPEVFQSAQHQGNIADVVRQSPHLNPYHQVQFRNGKTAIPLQIHIWQWGGKNFLLMKERFFEMGNRGLLDSLYVAILKRQTPRPDQTGSRQLIADMVCHIRE